MNFSPLAEELLEKRYLLEGESPEEMFRRVAGFVAEAESSDRIKQEEKFYKLLSSLDFLPNSPCLMNAGTKSPQLAACFVYPVEDDMESIFDTLKHTAITHKSGGGTGFSFSRLRPRGDKVKSTGGTTTGPVSFMEVYDKATEAVMQGGKRRGANMGMLRVDHPDIEEFITAKTEEDKLNNFNISVSVTDEFMEALEKDEEYNLYWPPGGKSRGKKNAKEIFAKIARGGWKNGEPGVIFIDRVNDKNPIKELGNIEAMNPCVPEDTWINTFNGPRQVKDITGRKTKIFLEGDSYNTEGFFKSGKKRVFKVITKEGFEAEATGDHRFLKAEIGERDKIYKKWVELKSLKKGDKVVINNCRNIKPWKGKYSREEGYLIGMLLGDGTFSDKRAVLNCWTADKGYRTVKSYIEEIIKQFPHRKDFGGWHYRDGRNKYELRSAWLRDLAGELGIKRNCKRISPEIEKTSYGFYQGFLCGFFDADGSVQGNQTKGVSVRLSQSDIDILSAVQRMLLRMGVAAKLYKFRRKVSKQKLPDGRGGSKFYKTKANHELVIVKDNIKKFSEVIGFRHSAKADKLKVLLKQYKRPIYRERFTAEIKEIIFSAVKDVYDASVEKIHSFSANGLVAHNCGEQPLLPYESCILGSINLSNHVKDGEINWDKLRETVRSGVEFLDDSIDVSAFPLKEITEIVKSNRKIGLGVMGFAAMLMKLDVSYNSQEAIKIARKVMKFIQQAAHKRSEELAREKGEFPNYFKSDIYTPRRNALITTIAPTGSISILAGTTSGIEPLFSLVTERQSPSGKNVVMAEPIFMERLKKEGLDADKIINKIREGKKLADIEEVPDRVKEVFATALGIPPEIHVLMQAAFQEYVDNAISKTVNLPEHFPLEGVKDIIIKAYRSGCKGITVYRHNARKQQVLNIVCECDNPGLDD